MAKGSLAKLYDQLTGPERLHLVIEAKARGDEIEVQRLVQSCPRANYNCGDDAYVTPMEATFSLVEAACHEFDRGMGRLQALDAVQFMISRSIEAIDRLKKAAKKRIENITETLEGISEMQIAPFRVAMLTEIKGVYEGLGRFSEDKFDMPADTLLKAFAPPYWEWLENLKEEISRIEADPKRVEYFEKMLSKGWDSRTEWA